MRKIHQALERHLFVTLDQSALNLALIARPEGNVFVLTPREAQHYIDLCLKAHEKYHIQTNYTANRSVYYWMRLWNLMPTFQAAWPFFDETLTRRVQLLTSVARLSKALQVCAGAEKVYVEAYYEVVPHLHLHLTARYPQTLQAPLADGQRATDQLGA